MRHHALWVVVCVLGFSSACVSGKVRECHSSADCLGGARCVTILGSGAGVCVADDAGEANGGPDGGSSGGGEGDGGGSDAHVDAGPSPCAATTCLPQWECRVSARDAGVCEFSFAGIEWVTPDAGSTFGPGDVIQLAARLTARPGFAPHAFPATLPLSASASAGASPFPAQLAHIGDGGYAAASAPVSAGSPSATWTLTATLPDGGLAAARSLDLDTTIPVAQIELLAAPARVQEDGGLDAVDWTTGYAGAYKRNESAVVAVKVTKVVPLSLASLSGPLASANALTEIACAGSYGGCSGAPVCKCFRADLWKPPFDAFRGSLDLTVNALTDAHHNTSVSATKAIQVTRLAWQRMLPSAVVSRLVLDTSGNVYVVLMNNSVVSVTQAGTLRAGFSGAPTSGSYVGSPVTLGSTLYMMVRDSTGPGHQSIQGLSTSTGLQTALACTVSPPRTFVVNDAVHLIASPIGAAGSAQDAVVGIAQGDYAGGTLVAFRPDAGTACQTLPFTGVTKWMVTDGTQVFTAGSGRPTQRAALTSSWEPPVVSTENHHVDGLALTGSTLAVNELSMVRACDTNGSMDSCNNTGSFMHATAIAGSTAAPVFVEASGWSVAYSPLDGGFGAPLSQQQPGMSQLDPPLIGRGGLSYFTPGGELSVNETATLATRWTITFSPFLALQGATLDALRTPGGTPTCDGRGILYATGIGGYFGSLFAMYVDSDGLDATAPWPMFQHDPANSGSSITSLAPWTCP